MVKLATTEGADVCSVLHEKGLHVRKHLPTTTTQSDGLRPSDACAFGTRIHDVGNRCARPGSDQEGGQTRRHRKLVAFHQGTEAHGLEIHPNRTKILTSQRVKTDEEKPRLVRCSSRYYHLKG